MRRLQFLLVSLLACFSLAAHAVGKVQVLALFPDKAMLSIDGKQRLLRAGQTSPEGIRLVSASPGEAVVIWGGEERTLRPGGGISTNYAELRQREVRIVRDNRGSYTTSGTINGRAVDFLVDTGASGVAMSASQARHLGIPYELTGTPTTVGTAGGVTRGYRVTLDRVRIGELELRQVGGVVIEAPTNHRVLLGMSFLNRLDMSQQDNVMVLRQR
jgi:aspartyl protease family protein